ncbi:MAG: helix-turn-helix transcriptional regulator [Micavibrio aeruginosavorus]|uniref:Helix-turn-helix transcriptional regulator n=1 Tax=Micavibrio aeruginosavorus TaxID=349221 RepID=A0A7T5R1L0_9BACT|nr:MAG: helix-turn-helix transcriptional regulator [Micavibrio aeruginosavorus]
MKYDLIHIQGKPYVLVPLHEYRTLQSQPRGEETNLPATLIDQLYAGQDNPIKTIRKYRGMTQTDLARASGVSRPYLAEIETGRKQGSLNALKLLAAALQVPLGLLAGEESL